MTPSLYIQDPWKEKNAHPAYQDSFLHMRPAPEYASGEVLMASLYRNIGFDRAVVTEGKVPKLGRDFRLRLEREDKSSSQAEQDAKALRQIVDGPLCSPKQPHQTNRRFLQICPLVPDAAIYSLSARLSANSWNPGELIAKVIAFGEQDHVQCMSAWTALFEALTVGHNDDVWARFLQKEFESRRESALIGAWREPATFESFTMPIKVWAATAQVNIPAKQFVQDLRKVIEVKDRLTRRQWISLLESLLRLGAASHILWICRANSECFHVLDRVIKGDAPPTEAYLREQLSTKTPFWRYGQPAARTIKEFARDFVLARVGLNLILWHWRALNTDQEPSLASVPNIVEFARTLSAKRSEFPTQQYLEHFRAAIDDDPGVVNCKRGISSNISEFLKHVLGQRQTSEPGMDSYDQGYYLRKRGNHASAPWMFALGPVSVLTLAHCCTSASQGLPTVEDFCQHLEQYGIEARGQDVAHNDLGLILRNLGLVVDSPDAEGGMVLINPLTRTTTKVPA